MTSAQSIVKALGGRWDGKSGLVRCLAHDDRNPSLSVSAGDDGRLLLHCHAGCDFRDIHAALVSRGLIEPPEPRRAKITNDDRAGEIWAQAVDATGTLVETYLRSRWITLAVPPCLRFSPRLHHHPSGKTLPAMVAAVQCGTPGQRPRAVHRTYLETDGRKAGVRPPKMAIGSFGSGAVHLAPAGPALGIAEGIETALSAMQLWEIPVWAALGSRLDRVDLPEIVREVQIFADRGVAGGDAAIKAAVRFKAEGRRVFIRAPTDPYGDWNDYLQASPLSDPNGHLGVLQ